MREVAADAAGWRPSQWCRRAAVETIISAVWNLAKPSLSAPNDQRGSDEVPWPGQTETPIC